MKSYCLVGPAYPFRGGIAHYTTLLARELRQSHDTLFISFTRQYPRWLFPGRDDRDPSQRPLKTEVEYLLDPLNPLSWRRTLRRIDQWSPNVVVMPWWVPYWAPAWAAIGRGVKRQKPAPKLIFICHNVLPHEKGLIDATALRTALSPADGFLVHSQADADKLLAYFSNANVEVTPLPTYAALGELGTGELPADVPADWPLLLFCGFVRPYKGLDILLDALPEVLAQRDVHLLVAGEFWEGEQRYREQIDRLNIGRAVTLVDSYLPNESLATCIARSDVVILPYRSATQSAVIQLAFGQNKPVITTDVGGLAEVVDDGRTGLVVTPEDPRALAAAINRFFEEDLGPAFREQIGLDRERFSWQQLITTITDLVRSVEGFEAAEAN